ncbi:FAD-dependent monooxygenase [Dyadobacter sp. CY327]|uniref:FAD-dependent monooxygenase n=1 Tax=Dyadobacter sp. CY327 TaxID=2907301 RepID=UPI001F2E4BEC|nr:FAD-dependent monooxygenase [Dyadobacter sp. CY327]MCE7072575.1 FAD-dependent monooxygenase [Dyadobacter sp. CY327]
MKIAISGAGIAGLTAAIAFQKAGYETTIFEAAPHLKPVGAGLGLAPNAIKALDVLGIADGIIPLGRKLPYFRILDRTGQIISENDSKMISEKFGLDNFSIHRHTLHEALLAHIDPASIIKGKKAIGIERVGKKITLDFADSTTYQADYLIVADGINSLLRSKIAADDVKRYAGYTCWRGVVEDAGSLAHGASETWDTSGRFGIVPLNDGKIYWFACVRSIANNPVFNAFGAQDLAKWFRKFHHPIPEILSKASHYALIHNDIYDLAPLAHYAHSNILLVGDAAHATTPNMGQGACQAMEDAATLLTELRKDQPLEKVFAEFESKRMERTQYVIRQSRMIGKIAQTDNLLLAKLRNALLRMSPASSREKQFEKLYNVTF